MSAVGPPGENFPFPLRLHELSLLRSSPEALSFLSRIFRNPAHFSVHYFVIENHQVADMGPPIRQIQQENVAPRNPSLQEEGRLIEEQAPSLPSDEGREEGFSRQPPSSQQSAGQNPPASSTERHAPPNLRAKEPSFLQNTTQINSSRQGISSPAKSFTPQEISTLLQKIAVANLLFKMNGDPATEALSPFHLLVLSQKISSLSKRWTELTSLLEHMVQEHPELPEEKAALFHKEYAETFKELQKIAQELKVSLKEKSMPEDPLKAASELQESCKTLKSQAEAQLDEKLQQLSSLLKASSAPKKDAELGLAPPGEQTSSLSERIAGQGTFSESGIKGEKPLPVTVSSPVALHALAEKLQKKELTFPLLLNVIYPLESKKEGKMAATLKTSSSKDKKGSASLYAKEGGKAQPMVLIPQGPLLLDHPPHEIEVPAFLLGTVPITNDQYAAWLSSALLEKKIDLTEKGLIVDARGILVCTTIAAVSTSQIQAQVSEGTLFFAPISGKEHHPAIHVTYHGALLYCLDNHFRLPQESEWERAAGMDLERPGEKPKLFLFGCGKDAIDPTLANYRNSLRESTESLTTPVAFYNGETVLTKEGKSFATQNSTSPYGCYDMCGNAWQWVQSTSAHVYVAKGGSYNTPPEELYVRTRKIFDDPRTSSAEVGFRVAMDLV